MEDELEKAEDLAEDEEAAEDEADEETEKSGLDPEASDEVESSLEEMLARKKSSAEDHEESIFDLSQQEQPGSLSIRTIPPKANEFVCSSCNLVKHQSQLADRRRRLCRDCA